MMNLEIPSGLGDMLKDFTVAVLREKPSDLNDYAVEYFTRARDISKPKTVPMYIIVDDDEAGEPDLKPKTNKNKYARRNSVSAERYDPEADDDEKEKVVYPKSPEQRNRLKEALGGILIFRSLDSDQINDVIDAMFEKNVTDGEVVIKQGDDGDNFYVIDSGTYDVIVDTNGDEKKVFEFDNKGSFGELALMYNMPRSATIRASEDGVLWAMDRSSFQRIILKAAFKKRKLYERLLEHVPMLQSIDQYERMNLADALLTKIFADGDVIISQGDEADGMYFIEDGSVYISINKDAGHVERVGSLCEGKYFGELALIENKPRSANVVADGKVKAAFLERESFERLLGPCLDIMKRNSEIYKKYAGKK
ncbi:cAMP-dependent protein kinase type II regulatory subunit-like [Haliotis rubra]|uniref:cAMP-dependent protein kinase type II regulatory subunit-like n=1 Tax=Haliotis rubra TaxID=36100 RepID=UPI001EE57844|nr:cAMP-dependent protein kinase type II regulatory subunit-like [Haliotis rubra]